MPIDADSLKQDSRSPQQLAQAILNHEFSPSTTDFVGVAFREQLQYNAEQTRHPAALLFSPLIELAEGRPLSPQAKLNLAHGLQVTDAYRQDSTRSRDIYVMHANPDLRPRNAYQRQAHRAHVIHGRPSSDAQREAQEDMATSVVEIGNLNAIEKLLRALASHPEVKVKLIEPGRITGRE
jgi:hypothetical protein